MSQFIEVPDLGTVEFPDGMTDDEITSAIQANLKPAKGRAAAAGTALAHEATTGIGHLLQGFAGAAELAGGMNPEELRWMPADVQEAERKRVLSPPAEKLERIKSSPIYQQGADIVAGAAEAYPVDPNDKRLTTRAAGMAGGFLPLLATGPLAPATIGLQSGGAHLADDFDALKAQGATDDQAASTTLNRALGSGALQSTIFLALPKPLKLAGEKFLIEKFGTTKVKEFLAGRVTLGAEGAVLGAASTAGENVVSDRPVMQDVGAGAAGLGAMNLFLPPYFRGRRNGEADALEAELGGGGGGASVPASRGPEIIPPERQLRNAPIITPPPEPVPRPPQTLAEIEQFLRDLPASETVAETARPAAAEVTPAPVAAIKPTENVPAAARPSDVARSAEAPASAPPEQSLPVAPVAVESPRASSPESPAAVRPVDPVAAAPVSPAAEAAKAVADAPQPLDPPAQPPKLRPGEKSGEMFQGADQPFNLMGERAVDAERIARERAQAEANAQAAKEFADKNQLGFLDQAQAAVEGRIAEIKREGRMRALADPELGMLRAAQGAIYVLKGVKNFAEWSAQMVAKFGREIEPALRDLWEQSKQIANGTHPTIGLSQHGVRSIANEELSASVRNQLQAQYAKLTDESARTIAAARVASVGGPAPAAEALLRGEFDGEPGKVKNAIAANALRSMALQERGARERGDTATADRLADKQVELSQRSIENSVDAGQTLQSFKLFYEFFTPAAWLRKFRRDVGSVAATRVQEATGKPVENTPTGVARGIADGIADGLEKTNPGLAGTVRDQWGSEATPGTLADKLKAKGKTAKQAEATAKKVSDFYEREAGKFRKRHNIPEFDANTEREVLARAKAIDALPENSVQKREATLRLLDWLWGKKGFKWHELPLDFWYANVLSGPTTHFKNIVGNSGNLAAEVAVQMLQNPGAIPSILEALGRALPRARIEAENIIRTGHDTGTRHAGKFETRGPLQQMGQWALPWKLVGRALKAEDVMFFYPLQEVKAAVLASRQTGLPLFSARRLAKVRRVMGWSEGARARAEAQAKAEGLSGSLYQRRVAELLEQSRPETLMDNARDFAFMGTFNNDVYGVLGSATRAWEGFARQHPYLKLVAPFPRIITNIANSGLNWTPVGYWRSARAKGYKLLVGRADATGKLYGREITDPTAVGDLTTRATLGTLVLGGLAMAAGQYIFDQNPQLMVTGSGPTDPNQRKLLRESGWLPYSLKVGDRYYTYQNQAFALPLAVLGHYLDAVRYRKLDEQDALNRVAFAGGSIFNVFVQGSWLQGLASFMQAANQDSAANPLKALPQQALRTGSSFVVPNALRQVDQLFDPTRYTAEDIRQMMLAQVPFARRNNAPDLNVFGQPVSAPLSKGFMSKVEGDQMTRLLAGRRLWPSVPSDPYLTPGQTHQLLRYRGPLLRASLFSNYADLATLPRAEAQSLVERISRQTTDEAKQALGLDTLSGIERDAAKARTR